jgi:ribose transport system substrate-binding protein
MSLRLCAIAALICCGCRSSTLPAIAVIPRTAGTALWEPVHGGAERASLNSGMKIYWNAPTREDDVQAQIALVQRVVDRRYAGLVLAPDQSLALISPVLQALSKGIPTVVIGSPLPIPPSGKLSYILNDEEEGAKIAAERIVRLVNGQGTVAVLGINPDIIGTMQRARILERLLAAHPEIKIVEKHLGSFNVQQDQQVAEETLRENPQLDVIVGLTSAATRGACFAVRRTEGRSKVIGFDDPDAFPLLEHTSLDSIIVQNSREIGFRAVRAIVAQLEGEPFGKEQHIKPILVTRENSNSMDVREIFSMDWRPQ